MTPLRMRLGEIERKLKFLEDREDRHIKRIEELEKKLFKLEHPFKFRPGDIVSVKSDLLGWQSFSPSLDRGTVVEINLRYDDIKGVVVNVFSKKHGKVFRYMQDNVSPYKPKKKKEK